MTCDHRFRNPVDTLGPAYVNADGTGVTFIEPLSPEMVAIVRSSANRVFVTVQFVGDDERLIDVNGDVL